MNKSSNALILMATFNASKYILETLNSFPRECDLFVSDDNSTDNTTDILKRYDNANILLHKNYFRSAAKNFAYLLNNCSKEYEYYFLADQDDLWIDTKYHSLISKMQEIENLSGKNTPILIYGDSTVVDDKLNIIDNSFLNYDGLSIRVAERFENLIFQNVGQGATMIFNQAFIAKIKEVPLDIYMHDWWLMLFAKKFGILEFHNCPNILYRQHANNVIGASKRNVFNQIMNVISGSGKVAVSLNKIRVQSDLFLKSYFYELNERDVIFLQQIDMSSSFGFFRRKFFLIKHKIRLSSVKRTLALYFFF